MRIPTVAVSFARNAFQASVQARLAREQDPQAEGGDGQVLQSISIRVDRILRP